MPKSRRRARGDTRLVQHPNTFGRWGKWLAAVPLVALLIATFIGIFGAQASATIPGK